MSRLSRNIDQFSQSVSLALTNAAAIPEIGEALALYGYDASRIQAGAALLAQVETLQAAQKQEYSEQYTITDSLNTAWDAADKTYTIHRKLAKLALRAEPDAQKALLLHQRKKENLDGWLGQTDVFYKNALGDAAILAALGQYNVTSIQLSEAQTAVAQVAALNADQEREKSEAQRATKTRDAAVDDLNDWYTEFRDLAQIALADDPQWLEALGLGPVA